MFMKEAKIFNYNTGLRPYWPRLVREPPAHAVMRKLVGHNFRSMYEIDVVGCMLEVER